MVLCSDGESECPEESSCCQSADGQFGCCPMPHAVCCEDKTHCCSEGSSCDVQLSKCISLSSQKELPMWAKFPARKRADWENQKESHHVTAEAVSEDDMPEPSVRASNVTCDPTQSCPDDTTCCSDGQGGWGCCPYPNAVCCSDHQHCCPSGMTCDLGHVTCNSGSEFTTMSQKTPAVRTTASATTTESQVIELTQTEESEEDDEQDYEDDDDDDEDVDDDDEEDDQDKVHCNHHNHCPRNSTCCHFGHRRWRCCPMPHAVCCSDSKHCCPQHFNCSKSHQGCVRDDVVVPWYKKLPAKSSPEPQVSNDVPEPRVRASNVTCDPKKSCPDDNTCCSDGQGGWGCCPYPNAVCCSDHRHCCPSGMTCDLGHVTCDSGSEFTTMRQKTPAARTTAPATATESQFIEMTQTEESEEDDEQDYDDDDDDDEDDDGKVHCNHHNHCPRNSTCCHFGHRRWGCCLMPHAVCCSDGKHCCPRHHKCNKSHQGCVRDDVVIPWYKKLPAKSSPEPQVSNDVPEPSVRASNVTCDPTQSCPDDTTCCSDGQGGWGCCPYPNAVCCSDHQRCCPSGTTCDLGQGTCNSGSEFTIMSQKTPAVRTTAPATATESQVIELTQTEESEEDDEQDSEDDDDDDDDDDEDDQDKLHCNHHNHCPRNSTCCRFGHRRWRCCPMPHAVCCSDSKHCCPQHFNCSKSHQGCVRDDVVVPWYKKLPAKSSPEPQVSNDVAEPGERASNVTCDLTHTCPDDTTCCSDGEGGWACCPFPNAVCCTDHVHCCPSGWTCDLAQQACVQASDSIPMSQMITEPAPTEDSQEEDEEDEEEAEDHVHCDGHTSCPRDTTCCRMGDKWGCCPLQHAVCCSDRKHCCPEHYNCSKSHQACVRDDVVIPWYTKLPAVSSVEADSETDYVRCRDKKLCPPYNTCCLLSSGEYGCCPMENAVCCSDNKHCCPQGYTCDISSQLCERAVLLEVALVPLTPVSLPKTEPVRETFVQCDCPDTFKCCEVTPSQWFCCPYTYGVCCSGSDYCCPQGKRCAPGGGCSSNSWLPWDNWPFFRREQKKPQIL